jgi:hypothetical protein
MDIIAIYILSEKTLGLFATAKVGFYTVGIPLCECGLTA